MQSILIEYDISDRDRNIPWDVFNYHDHVSFIPVIFTIFVLYHLCNVSFIGLSLNTIVRMMNFNPVNCTSMRTGHHNHITESTVH